MIEPWLQDLVGIPYTDNGCTPEKGFYCTGLARYIYRTKFNRELPIDPLEWRQMFTDLGKTRDVEPYDLIVLINSENQDSHIAIACDDKELIHARKSAQSVTLEPIDKHRPAIRSIFRLK